MGAEYATEEREEGAADEASEQMPADHEASLLIAPFRPATAVASTRADVAPGPSSTRLRSASPARHRQRGPYRQRDPRYDSAATRHQQSAVQRGNRLAQTDRSTASASALIAPSPDPFAHEMVVNSTHHHVQVSSGHPEGNRYITELMNASNQGGLFYPSGSLNPGHQDDRHSSIQYGQLSQQQAPPSYPSAHHSSQPAAYGMSYAAPHWPQHPQQSPYVQQQPPTLNSRLDPAAPVFHPQQPPQQPMNPWARHPAGTPFAPGAAAYANLPDLWDPRSQYGFPRNAQDILNAIGVIRDEGLRPIPFDRFHDLYRHSHTWQPAPEQWIWAWIYDAGLLRFGDLWIQRGADFMAWYVDHRAGFDGWDPNRVWLSMLSSMGGIVPHRRTHAAIELPTMALPMQAPAAPPQAPVAPPQPQYHSWPLPSEYQPQNGPELGARSRAASVTLQPPPAPVMRPRTPPVLESAPSGTSGEVQTGEVQAGQGTADVQSSGQDVAEDFQEDGGEGFDYDTTANELYEQ